MLLQLRQQAGSLISAVPTLAGVAVSAMPLSFSLRRPPCHLLWSHLNHLLLLLLLFLDRLHLASHHLCRAILFFLEFQTLQQLLLLHFQPLFLPLQPALNRPLSMSQVTHTHVAQTQRLQTANFRDGAWTSFSRLSTGWIRHSRPSPRSTVSPPSKLQTTAIPGKLLKRF